MTGEREKKRRWWQKIGIGWVSAGTALGALIGYRAMGVVRATGGTPESKVERWAESLYLHVFGGALIGLAVGLLIELLLSIAPHS